MKCFFQIQKLLFGLMDWSCIMMDFQSVISVFLNGLPDPLLDHGGKIGSIRRFKVNKTYNVVFIQCKISCIVIRYIIITLQCIQNSLSGLFTDGSFLIQNLVNCSS